MECKKQLKSIAKKIRGDVRQLIIIIIGVCVSLIGTLIITDLYTERSNNKTKKNIIEGLQESLRADTIHINDRLASIDTLKWSIDSILALDILSISELSDECINRLVHNASHGLSFSPNISTFETYKYTGELKLLKSSKSDSLLKTIFSLYDIRYKRIFDIVKLDHGIIEKIDDFLIDHAQYIEESKFSYSIKANKNTLVDLLKEEKYKQLLNMNRVVLGLLKDAFEKAKKGDEQNKTSIIVLLDMLDKELN